jgi:integrase
MPGQPAPGHRPNRHHRRCHRSPAQEQDSRRLVAQQPLNPYLAKSTATEPATALEPRKFSRSFDRCITKAQVPRITVHGTRKTCGSLLAALDVHPRVAMQIMRHSKIAITMEIYTEVPSAATRHALKKLGQWLGS